MIAAVLTHLTYLTACAVTAVGEILAATAAAIGLCALVLAQLSNRASRLAHVPPLRREETHRARVQRARATPAERTLWSLLRGRALGAKFRRQHPLGRYIVDFFCCDAGLVVEVDGDVHDTDRARRHDAVRDAFLVACGLRIVRVRNVTVLQTPERALAIIRAALFDGAPLPPGEGMG